MATLTPLLFALAASSADGGVGRRVIDRVVAVVSGQPLTFSELEFEARVALIRQGGLSAASAPLDEEVLARTLDYAIGQRLAAEEAERLRVFEPSAAEVSEAQELLARRFPDAAAYQAFLARYEFEETELWALLHRDLRASRYLASKVKLRAAVSAQEVNRYLEDHPNEVEGLKAEVARQAVEEKLMRERVEELTRVELSALRARGAVRLVAPFFQRSPR